MVEVHAFTAGLGTNSERELRPLLQELIAGQEPADFSVRRVFNQPEQSPSKIVIPCGVPAPENRFEVGIVQFGIPKPWKRLIIR